MSKRILVVDDDSGILTWAESVLKPKGYDVLLCDDPIDALQIIKSNNLDLVVLDIMMPELDGYQIINKILIHEDSKALPILILTSQEQKLDDDLGKKVHIDYMRKPADTDAFLQKIEALIGAKPNRK